MRHRPCIYSATVDLSNCWHWYTNERNYPFPEENYDWNGCVNWFLYCNTGPGFGLLVLLVYRLNKRFRNILFARAFVVFGEGSLQRVCISRYRFSNFVYLRVCILSEFIHCLHECSQSTENSSLCHVNPHPYINAYKFVITCIAMYI